MGLVLIFAYILFRHLTDKNTIMTQKFLISKWIESNFFIFSIFEINNLFDKVSLMNTKFNNCILLYLLSDN